MSHTLSVCWCMKAFSKNEAWYVMYLLSQYEQMSIKFVAGLTILNQPHIQRSGLREDNISLHANVKQIRTLQWISPQT